MQSGDDLYLYRGVGSTVNTAYANQATCQCGELRPSTFLNSERTRFRDQGHLDFIVQTNMSVQHVTMTFTGFDLLSLPIRIRNLSEGLGNDIASQAQIIHSLRSKQTQDL